MWRPDPSQTEPRDSQWSILRAANSVWFLLCRLGLWLSCLWWVGEGALVIEGNELAIAWGSSASNLSDFQVVHSVPSWILLLDSG